MTATISQVLRDCAEAAVLAGVNPRKRRNCFELLGVDFMVTSNFELMLIEVRARACVCARECAASRSGAVGRVLISSIFDCL